MEKKNFDLKLVDSDSINKMGEMFALCFNLKLPENYFNWKFLQNPAGQVIGFIAYHEGEAAGYYGLIPEYYMVDGKKTVIYQSTDTMTHPHYQRQGLFTKLANKTLEYLKEKDGEIFALGFPGNTSHPGFVNKLGWKDIVSVNLIFLHHRFFKFKSFFKKSSDLTFEQIENFDESFDLYFKNKTYPAGKISHYLDKSFLDWRFSNNPLQKHEIVKVKKENEIIGFLVYRTYEKKRCFIHHIDFVEEDLYEKYLGNICKFLFDNGGNNYIYIFEPTLPLLTKAFKDNGFIKNTFSKRPFSYKPPLIGYSNREKINNIDFFQKESYNIQPVMRDY